MNALKFFTENWEKIIVIGLAYFTALLPLYKYLQEKRIEEKDKRFRNYHKLIDDLLGGAGKNLMLDRQIAIVFELRNYKEYYPVTLRILKGLTENWVKISDYNIGRLRDEIKLTEQHITSSIK